MISTLPRPLNINLRYNTHIPFVACSYRYHALSCHLKTGREQRYYARPELSNAVGTSWCIDCEQRYRLIELAQRYYLRDAWWLSKREYQASDMLRAVRWAQEASEQEIIGVCQLFGIEQEEKA